VPLLTPLTRANHRAAWNERSPQRRVRQPAGIGLGLPASCRYCGSPLPNHRRRYCDNCRREQLAKQASAGRANAAAVLARLRAEQRDPGHGGRAAQIRGTKNAAHQRAVREWDGELPDPVVFTREILPGLRGQSIPELVAATGLSSHYCSMIRLGSACRTHGIGRHLQELPNKVRRRLGASAVALNRPRAEGRNLRGGAAARQARRPSVACRHETGHRQLRCAAFCGARSASGVQ
jgi:hypothetical protein